MALKLFKTKIVSQNNCYVRTFLVVEESPEAVKERIKSSRASDGNPDPYIEYKSPIEEVVIDMTTPNMISVSFDPNEDFFTGDED